MSCVYYLVCSEEQDRPRYVGITKHDSPSRRLVVHRQHAKNGSQLPVHRWMRKHETKGHKIVAVTVHSGISWAKACEIEVELISKLRKSDSVILNVLDGGQGASGLIHSDTSIEIMRKTGKINAHNAHNARREQGLKWGVDLGPKPQVPTEIIERIVSERDKGLSYSLIAKGLNADKIPTVFGKRWHAATIRDVFLREERKKEGREIS